MSLTKEQLELRKTGITATDATAICGMNPYRGAFAVWLDKVGEMPEQVMNEEAIELGHEMEPLIMERLSRTRGLLLQSGETVRSAREQWVLATPDRFVIDVVNNERMRVGVAEAKNVGIRTVHDWGDADDGMPDYVHVQVQWQMLATNLRAAYVAALLAGTAFRVIRVEHDDALAETLLNVCGDFYQKHVIGRVPPPPDGSKRTLDLLSSVFPRESAGIIPAPADAEMWAEKFIAARKAESAAKKAKKEAEARLKLMCGKHLGLASTNWQLKWATTKSWGVDWEGLARAIGATPELIEKFKKPGVRTFMLTEKKTAGVAVVEDGDE